MSRDTNPVDLANMLTEVPSPGPRERRSSEDASLMVTALVVAFLFLFLLGQVIRGFMHEPEPVHVCPKIERCVIQGVDVTDTLGSR